MAFDPKPFLEAAQQTFGNTRPEQPSGLPGPALKPSDFPVRHAATFQSVLTNVAKNYRWAFDAALQQSPEDARAMLMDGGLVSLLNERRRPISVAKWHIESEDDSDPEQQSAIEMMTTLIKRIRRFSRMRYSLRWCNWWGKAGVALAVKKKLLQGQERWHVTNWLPVHGDKFTFRFDGTPALLVRTQDVLPYRQKGYRVEPTEHGYVLFLDQLNLRERYIIDTFEVIDADFFDPQSAGQISGVGLRHWCQWIWWLRSEVHAELMNYIAQIGAGGLTLIKYAAGNDEALKAAQKVAADLQTGNTLLIPVPEGTTKPATGVERIEPSSTGAEIIQDVVDSWFDAKMERLIVGQKMSGDHTGSGGLGGSGAADLASNTKYNLILGDAIDQDETLTEDLIQPLMRWNLPNADYQLRFVTDLSTPDSKDRLAAAKTICDMGGTLITDEVRALGGFGKPQEGDETLGGQMAGMPGMPGGPDGAGLPGMGGPAPGSPMMPAGAPNGDEHPNDQNAGIQEGIQGNASEGSSAEIQQYFMDAVQSGKLFDRNGLRQLKYELEDDGWKFSMSGGLQKITNVNPAAAGHEPTQFAREFWYTDPNTGQWELAPDEETALQLARQRAEWSSYTNPEDGRHGWKSRGGVVRYADPTQHPDEHPQGRQSSSDEPAKPIRHSDNPQLHDKTTRHVGVQRGKAGGLEGVTSTLGGMLDNPESVTVDSMRGLVDSLMGLTTTELNQLRQQYGGKRGRKGEMVQGLTKRLQDEGLPSPETKGSEHGSGNPAAPAAPGNRPAGGNGQPGGPTEADIAEAHEASAQGREFDKRMAETRGPLPYRDPTIKELATGIDDPQMAYHDVRHHGSPGREPNPYVEPSIQDRMAKLRKPSEAAKPSAQGATPAAQPAAEKPKERKPFVRQGPLKPGESRYNFDIFDDLEPMGGDGKGKGTGPVLSGSPTLAPEQPPKDPLRQYPGKPKSTVGQAAPAKPPMLDRIRAMQKGKQAAPKPAPVSAPKPAPLTPAPNGGAAPKGSAQEKMERLRMALATSPSLPEVQPGAKPLTTTEKRTLEGMSGGLHPAGIAKDQGVSRQAVDARVKGMKPKLGPNLTAFMDKRKAERTSEKHEGLLDRMSSTDANVIGAELPKMASEYDKDAVSKAGGARLAFHETIDAKLDKLVEKLAKETKSGTLTPERRDQIMGSIAELHRRGEEGESRSKGSA